MGVKSSEVCFVFGLSFKTIATQKLTTAQLDCKCIGPNNTALLNWLELITYELRFTIENKNYK